MVRHVPATWVSIVALAVLAIVLPAGADEAQDRRIAAAIADLGHADFSVREAASAALWREGAAAESALREALSSRDPEVVSRALAVLDQVESGCRPEMPAELIAAIRAVRAAEPGEARVAAAARLLDHGHAAHPALVSIALRERDSGRLAELGRGVPGIFRLAARHLLVHGTSDDAIALLERTSTIASDDRDEGLRDLAALHLSRGTLEAAIARATDQGAVGARLLFWLARANLDHERALAAARAIGDASLVEASLYDQRRWDELLAAGTRRYEASSDPDDAQRLAAYAWLAGDMATYDRLFGEILSGCGELKQAIVRGRPVKDLLPDADDRDELGPWREARREYDEALARYEGVPRARLLALLGRTDESRIAFDREVAGADDTDEDERARTPYLLRVMAAAGHEAAARAHLVSVLSRTPPPGRPRIADTYWRRYPPEAGAWWRACSALEPEASIADTVEHVDRVLSGRGAPDALVSATRSAAARGIPFDELAALQRAVGRAGQLAAVEGLLVAAAPTAADPAQAWATIGELAAEAGRWELAEHAHRTSSQLRPTVPKALFHHTRALARLDRGDEASAQLARACMVALADDEALFREARHLERPVDRDFLRQRFIRVAAPDSFYLPYAIQALTPSVERDAGALACRCYDALRTLLRVIAPNTSSDGYVSITLRSNLELARAAQVLGRPNAVRYHAEAAWGAAPHDVSAILLRAATHLDRGAVVRMYADEHAHWRGLVARHPNSYRLLNDWAWFSARARTGLDEGLAAAQRATTLDPTVPNGFDTLAEVWFQRGDRTAALRAIERALSLAPESAYYQRQRVRMATGDAASEPE